MVAVNLEEYREWLKENGNLEEAKAPEVIEKVVKRHLSKLNWKSYKIDISPRKVFKVDGKHYECDATVKLTWQAWDNKTRSMMIGIEFKEWDFSKVVSQAVHRKRFFDYMYIATRPVTLSLSWNPYDFALLIKHGIGWVLWSEDFVYILLPAKKKGWERAEEMAERIERLMNTPLQEPKTIMDYVR
ncbi:hypothetical protein [Thermococcus sp.]|uniref:hypothetical protein n=1 Tax=Thermococcus sp. TaxID=35749 RepID=UPI0025E5A6EB|nr:hypothetical protein [Thermococcus sp.]